MLPVDPGLIISIGAVLIALWNGRSASTQAQASVSQADSSRAQADSAKAQADSAKVEELTASWSARLAAVQARYDLLSDTLEKTRGEVTFFRAHAERCERDIRALQERVGITGEPSHG